MTRRSHTGRPGSQVIDEHLWAAVRAVQSLGLVDLILVTRPSDTMVLDPVTLIETPGPPLIVYDDPDMAGNGGPGNCQPMTGLNERRVIVAGETRTANRYVVSIEWDTAQVLIGDEVTVVASADPRMVGRPLVVRDVLGDTFQSRRVLICEDDAALPTPEMEVPGGS